MAEIELSVLAWQCLDRRNESAEVLVGEVEAWEMDRNERMVEVKWQFTTADARIKLRRLYPTTQQRRSTRSAPPRLPSAARLDLSRVSG